MINFAEFLKEAEKKGLYYYVNRRKRLGISRDKDHPDAPTEQDFKNAAKTAKESYDPEEAFDMIEDYVDSLCIKYGIDPLDETSSDFVWDAMNLLSDEQLFNEAAAWQRKEGKSETGGLNAKGVASYRRENPGSKLQMAVTTKPSKLKKGSKAYNRRKSFCARMSGVEGPMKDENGKPTRKALALKKWNC